MLQDPLCDIYDSNTFYLYTVINFAFTFKCMDCLRVVKRTALHQLQNCHMAFLKREAME